MSKKYLVVLKNPPSSFMVDGYTDNKILKQMKMASFIQEDMALWIPIDMKCNIAYISEMTDEEVLAMEERLEAQKEKQRELSSKLVKPKLKTFSTKH